MLDKTTIYTEHLCEIASSAIIAEKIASDILLGNTDIADVDTVELWAELSNIKNWLNMYLKKDYIA